MKTVLTEIGPVEIEVPPVIATARSSPSSSLVGLLVDKTPTTRQAALYGLGALADDWDVFGRSDEVQVYVEAITAHLRAPLPDGAKRTDRPPH